MTATDNEVGITSDSEWQKMNTNVNERQQVVISVKRGFLDNMVLVCVS